MNLPNIDFRRLRQHRNSLNDGFEELTRQLVLADLPNGHSAVENRGPGADGGVEILVRFPDGRVWGWQSKFFDAGFDTSEVAQLKTSFSAALTNYPELEKYFVAIPRNLSGSDEGENNTQTKKWRVFKEWAEDTSLGKGKKVEIELWDDTYFVSKLQSNDPIYAGIRSYWFDQDVFPKQWFDDKFAVAKARIGNRYTPQDHVDLDVRTIFDLFTRNDAVQSRYDLFRSLVGELEFHSAALSAHQADAVSRPANIFLEQVRSALIRLDAEVNTIGRPMVDLAAVAKILRNLLRTSKDMSDLRDAQFARKPRDPELAPTSDEDTFQLDQETRERIGDLARCLSDCSGSFSDVECAILRDEDLLVLGEAGAGKSHLLADEISRHLSNGKPAIFIPARALLNVAQPGRSILDHLDATSMRFDVWLGALSAAALATDSYAIIALDGINESAAAAEWEAALPALLIELSKFPNIKLIISCRSVYEEKCIRGDLSVARIHHPGFQGNLSRAAKTFLDNHGIERSSAPIVELNTVLNNPLFLSAVVRGLKSENRTSFPRDLDSLPNILAYWIKSIERNLVDNRYERISPGEKTLERVIRALAKAMASTGDEQLSYEEASQLGESIIGLAPPTKSADLIIMRLLEEGLLLDFPSDRSESGKTVSFSFQKFGDYFIADAILKDAADINALALSLLPDGKYPHVFEEARAWAWEGVRVAVLALCPARFGEELPRVPVFGEKIHVTIKDFLASIPLRDRHGLTDKTVKLLERLRKPEGGTSHIDDKDWYDLLIKLATTPNSVLNARYLVTHLSKTPMPERDASWSYYLVGILESYDDGDYSSPAHELVDWAWNAPRQNVEIEQVNLAAIALTLMTSTMDRYVRDRASKALSSLFIKYPTAMPTTIDTFREWDDSYVRERLLAAGSAGALACNDKTILMSLAAAVDKMVFSAKFVERHAWTRRYAQRIVQRAHWLCPDIDKGFVTRSSPPYRSQPITVWPTLRETAAYKDSASSIVSSVVGWLSEPFEDTAPGRAGDFGRYTMGGIDNSFSQEVRSEKGPLTRKDLVESLFAEIRGISESIAATLDRLIDAKSMSSAADAEHMRTLLGRLSDDDLEKIVEAPPAQLVLKKRKSEADKLEEELLAKISEELRNRYRTLTPFHYHRSDDVPRFSLSVAQCWVVARCLDLGWSQDLHGQIEKSGLNYSYGRNDHRVERIGKKYQHIAHDELIGYLADHHWYLEYEEAPAILERLERYARPDIDPTFLAGVHSRPSDGYERAGLIRPLLQFASVGRAEDIAWTQTPSDLPDLTKLLVQQGEDGFEWCIVRSFTRPEKYMASFDSHGPTRNGQVGIELVLVPIASWPKLSELDQRAVADDPHDVFDNSGSSDRPFGELAASSVDVADANFLTPFTIGGIPFGRVYETYSPTYGSYDHSGIDEEKGFLVPSNSLLFHLNLKPESPFSRLFVDEDSNPAFIDDPATLDEWCVMRFDLVKCFADSNKLGIAWRVWFEKDGGEGSQVRDRSERNFVRKDYLGYYRLAGNGWVKSMNSFRD